MKIILKISTCLVFGISLIYILYGISNKITHVNNNFNRLLPPHPITKIKVFDLNVNSFYIAGTHMNEVYMGNITAPLYLLKTTLSTLDTVHYNLTVQNQDQLKFLRRPYVHILYPYFYLVDGITPALFRGILGQWYARPILNDSTYFSKAIPIGSKSFAIRAVGGETNEYVLGKFKERTPNIVLRPNILKKQIDGIFCTDGMLHYNKELHQIIYLYRYRNSFMTMDTTLTLLQSGKTIDTNNIAKIEVAKIKSENTKIMAKPPLMVNKHTYSYDELLFINSALMANNEELKTFKEASVIDVYDLLTTNYKFSFYLPNYKNYGITDFAVTKNYLIALHNKYLIIYKKNMPLFDKLK